MCTYMYMYVRMSTEVFHIPGGRLLLLLDQNPHEGLKEASTPKGFRIAGYSNFFVQSLVALDSRCFLRCPAPA